MDRRDFIRTSAFAGVYTIGSSIIPENIMLLLYKTCLTRWAKAIPANT